jgi:hypothetical protein
MIGRAIGSMVMAMIEEEKNGIVFCKRIAAVGTD